MNLYKEIESNFPAIEEQFTIETLSEFKSTQPTELYAYQFGLGTWIRNNLLYSNDSVLYRLFSENGIEHPDDMSSMIIRLFHYHISTKI